MAVSKRLRYEVLRRDNHTCRYCGASAPAAPLTVDHVIPVALGGADDPSNLVTACRDCNAGKSASSPDAPIVSDVKEKAMLWAAAMDLVASERKADRERRADVEMWFLSVWNTWTYQDWKTRERLTIPIPDGWENSLHQFIEAGLEPDDIRDLVKVAMTCKTTNDEWRYFCGCCWRRIREGQDRAAQIIQEAEHGA